MILRLVMMTRHNCSGSGKVNPKVGEINSTTNLKVGKDNNTGNDDNGCGRVTEDKPSTAPKVGKGNTTGSGKGTDEKPPNELTKSHDMTRDDKSRNSSTESKDLDKDKG
jgi:hypothetical protein